MILISNSKLEGKKISSSLGFKFLYLDVLIYPDGEDSLFLEGNPQIADIIYFKFDKNISLDEQFFKLVCLLNKFSNKKKTTLVLPYLPYLRSCPVKAEEVDKLSFVLAQFKTFVKKVYLLCPHNFEEVKQKFALKNVDIINVDDFIISYLRSLGKDPVLVSSDNGFADNVKKLAKKSGLEYVILYKKRISPTKVVFQSIDESNNLKIKENKNKLFIILDDIVSTGNTLLGAGLYLKKQGIKKVKYFTVHNTNRGGLKISVDSSNSIDGNKNGLNVLDAIINFIR